MSKVQKIRPRGVKQLLPRTLFGRSLLIILIPVLLVEIITTFFFFDRHWSVVTRRLSAAVAGEISTVAEEIETMPNPRESEDLLNRQSQTLDLLLMFKPEENLSAARHLTFNPAVTQRLSDALTEIVRRPFLISVYQKEEWLEVEIQLKPGVLHVLVPEQRLFTRAAYVFLLWMIGSSIVLSAVSLLFMRNQIRPIRRLAVAAEGFGKGRDFPQFKPEGSSEVRQAASAFIEMRDRIRRQITQRTEMLAGVSHDLRTPLTRMKLQLALMPKGADIEALQIDVTEMERMVEGYLAFARGEEPEAETATDIAGVVEDLAASTQRGGKPVTVNILARPILFIGRTALRRCIGNLLENAQRYASNTEASVHIANEYVEIIIDDDGPGIPLTRRNDVLKPFFRLEASRNINTGGVGLGLTIASDIARRHGGELILDDSPYGGLRAIVRLPA